MLAGRFRIGVQAESSAAGLEAALEAVLEERSWQFDAAWRSIDVDAMNREYVERVIGH
jgi:hypothetical protein